MMFVTESSNVTPRKEEISLTLPGDGNVIRPVPRLLKVAVFQVNVMLHVAF